MPRPRKRRRLDEAHLQRVLDGEELDVRQLCELIRRCNPSRLTLSSADRAQRYTWKGRLQSELIRRFSAELEVRPTAAPQIVALRLKGQHTDAGHAALAQLTEPARAWVEAALMAFPSRGGSGSR
jgi:hypothetical protein